jgi:hypothetical protein
VKLSILDDDVALNVSVIICWLRNERGRKCLSRTLLEPGGLSLGEGGPGLYLILAFDFRGWALSYQTF